VEQHFLGFGAPSHQAPPGTSHPSLVMNEAEEVVRGLISSSNEKKDDCVGVL